MHIQRNESRFNEGRRRLSGRRQRREMRTVEGELAVNWNREDKTGRDEMSTRGLAYFVDDRSIISDS